MLKRVPYVVRFLEGVAISNSK